jgi:hypothetical protein
MTVHGAMFAMNVMIAVGYLVAATSAVPGYNPVLWTKIRVRRTRTQVAGFVFFVSCAFTHVEIAVHTLTGITTADLVSWHMVAHVAVQLMAIFTFLHGIHQELLAVTSESTSR